MMIKLILLAIMSLHVDTLMIPWGSGDGRLGIMLKVEEDAGPNMGPLAFDVEDGKIAFLDIYNKRIAFFRRDGSFEDSWKLDGYFDNIVLWQGNVYLANSDWESITIARMENGKLVEKSVLRVGAPVVGASVNFLKDFSNNVMFIKYSSANKGNIETFFTLFKGNLTKSDFLKGDPTDTRAGAVVGYDNSRTPVLLRFKGGNFYFKHGKEEYRWEPIFFAQMDGPPYRIDRDGTLYIVNYLEEGVEILEVTW